MISKTTAKLTIGIPTKNRALMLAELLSDIEKYQADLPVVVSDNSDRPEDTAKVVKEYAERLKINYVHTEFSISQAENFNTVLNNSSTKYVVIMHDDDRFIPTSIGTYLSLVNYLDHVDIDVFGVYVQAFKFKNEDELNKVIDLPITVPDLIDIKENLKVFAKGEYLKYFVEEGIGGKAPGVVVNRFLMGKYNINFPTDTGAKHDKAFFLTANTLGSVGYWRKKVIAKRLHQSRSIHRKVTENYCLFNQKVLEIYQGDDLSIKKIHKKRFEKWLQDESGFKPLECWRLISLSQVGVLERANLFMKYFFHHLKTIKFNPQNT
ncbi:glycosyltransferase family 2 protein [Coleofasciculus chthonoplastes]|uniref:glycosyltransferase family 2 protein n=1 Tax=Coleofasciculus chthonoplastes TaxID=64178 RepID=UPI0032FC5BFC